MTALVMSALASPDGPFAEDDVWPPIPLSTLKTTLRPLPMVEGARIFEAFDTSRNVVVATITECLAGECWLVSLKIGQYRNAEDRDESPGDRNYRDFEGAHAYAEAWAWEVDGDL